MVNTTEVVTEIVTESVVSTTSDTINDVTSIETNTVVQLDKNQAANAKNGSLLWAQLHPAAGRVDEGGDDDDQVSDDNTTSDDTPDIVYVEEEEIVKIEIEVDQNITEIESVEINPKIITTTASTSGLRPTLVLIIASLFTLIMDN